jgi:hypothetical protein
MKPITHIRIEAFMVTEGSGVFSDDQLCRYGMNFSSEDCLCLHHQGLISFDKKT